MEGSQSETSKEDEGDHQQKVVEYVKGKSCKGCLYYSSILKSKSRKPLCVGLTRTLQQVPGYIVGESELEASKDGRQLTDFKYACVGYSVHLDNKNPSADPKEKPVELPFCVGIEFLVDKRASTADHLPARAHTKEDGSVHPQPRPFKPVYSPTPRQELFDKFKRNASLVASGVGKNMQRVGKYIKDNLDDALYPYRRRPK